MDFGEKLRKLRKEKNLSQEALAEKVKTTRQAVSKCTAGVDKDIRKQKNYYC